MIICVFSVLALFSCFPSSLHRSNGCIFCIYEECSLWLLSSNIHVFCDIKEGQVAFVLKELAFSVAAK